MGERGISVVIPVRNHQAYVVSCLMGVFRQSPMPDEVVVVDRGSTDATLPLVADRFKSARVLRCQGGAGLSHALNRGIKETTGSIVMVVFPEVKMERGYLRGILDAMDSPAHRYSGFGTGKIFRIYGGRGILDSAGFVFTESGLLPVKRGEGQADGGEFDAMEEVHGAPRGAVVYRRDALEKIACGEEVFDELLPDLFEDADLSLRARKIGIKGIYVPASVAYTDMRLQGKTPDAESDWEYSRAAVIIKNADSARLVSELACGAACRFREVMSGSRPALPTIFSCARLLADYTRLRARKRNVRR